MNLLQLAWSYLRARPLGTLLNVLLLALGVGTIGFVRIVDGQVGDSLNRDAQGIDLVVGAKGSPIQLILAGIYHLDVPTGNIPLKSVEELAKNPLIRHVIPISLGDSFRGYRIVGTSPDYIALYGGSFASGGGWNGKMEAVLGSTVAARTGLAVGGRFVGSHGLAEGGPMHG
ncbi:MAG: ABC transporter permease, partial [Betaproteobacteria bacterium]